MSRFRVFVGSVAGLVGIPITIACMADHSIGAVPFIGSTLMTALAIALLIPGRWIE